MVVLKATLFCTCLIFLNTLGEDEDILYDDQLELLHTLVAEAKNLSITANVPFEMGDAPTAEGLPEYFDKNKKQDEKKCYTRLKIDGVQIFGTSLYTILSRSVKFSFRQTRNCKRYLPKTSVYMQFKNSDVPVPCIYIGQQADANVIIIGLPEVSEEENEPLTEEDQKSMLQFFYKKFFLTILIPAIQASPLTEVYLRYSELIKRISSGKILESDTKVEVTITVNEWQEISSKMDKYKDSFYQNWKWKLYSQLAQFGQSIDIDEEYGINDILRVTGLSMFYHETLIDYFNIHVAVDLYCEIPDAIIVTKRHDFPAAVSKIDRVTNLEYFSNMGMGLYPSFKIDQKKTATLNKIKKNLLEENLSFEGDQVIDTNMKNNFNKMIIEYEKPECLEVYNQITFQFFQTYFASTHAIYPKQYKPHQQSPASEMIISGLRVKSLKQLRKDFNLWKNLIKQIQYNNIPLRIEFVLETQGLRNIRINEGTPDFSCTAILFESLAKSVYGVYDDIKEISIPGSLSYLMKKNVHIVPNFGEYIANTISALYVMLFCPLLNAYDISNKNNIDIEIASTYDIEGLLTVHLAENLLLYMFDGTVANQKDYRLLHKYYKVSQRTNLKVENIKTEIGKCGGVIEKHIRSKKILEELPQGFTPYLAFYKHPASYQRFFLIRQLSLVGNTLTIENSALAALYIDSCITAMRHFRRQFLPLGSTTFHNWLTFEHYKNTFSSLPKSLVTISTIKEYFLTKAFFENIDVVGVFLLRSAACSERFEKQMIQEHISKCKATIKRNLFPVLTNYALNGKLQVFYYLTNEDIAQLNEIGTLTFTLTQYKNLLNKHAKVSIGAGDFFNKKLNNEEPLRFKYSVPMQITQEILTHVFEIMHEKLKVFKSDLQKLDLQKHPVLPIIFRLWYLETEEKLNTYQEFLNHCAYAVTFILSKIKGERSYGIVRCSYDKLADFAQNHQKLKMSLFERSGLIHKSKPKQKIQSITEDEIKQVYRYWLGATYILELPVALGFGSEEQQFFEEYKQNRFHYTICDALELNINSQPIEKRQFIDYRYNDTNYPYVPDIYYFTPYFQKVGQPSQKEVQRFVTVMRVEPKYKQRRWIMNQDNTMQPKFLPLFMDADADSIVDKKLFENLPYAGYNERSGRFYNEIGEFLFDERTGTKILASDILKYNEYALKIDAPQTLNELQEITFDETGDDALRAWKLQKYVQNLNLESGSPDELPLPNVQDQELAFDSLLDLVQNNDQLPQIELDLTNDENFGYSNVLPSENEVLEHTNIANISALEHGIATENALLPKKRPQKRLRKYRKNRKSMANLIPYSARRLQSDDDDQNRNEQQELTNFERGLIIEREVCTVNRNNQGLLKAACANFAIQTEITDTLSASYFTTGTQRMQPSAKTKILLEIDKGAYVNVNAVSRSIQSMPEPYALRSQGSIETCSLQSISPKRSRLVCKDWDTIITKTMPNIIETCGTSIQCQNLQPRKNIFISSYDQTMNNACKETTNKETYRAREGTGPLNTIMSATHSQREQNVAAAVQHEKMEIEIRTMQPNDWYVIEVSGDGSCLFHTLHIMLQGFSQITNDGKARVDFGKVSRMRTFFMKHVTTDKNELGTHEDRLSYAAFNKNLWGIEYNESHTDLYDNLRRTLETEWGDEMAVKLFSYFTGIDVHVLFAFTSRQGLDWGKITWIGATNDENFLDYCPYHYLGPPFAVIHEQIANSKGQLEGKHWNLLLHKTKYVKYVGQCKEKYKTDPAEQEKLRQNRYHYNIGVPLGDYLNQFHQLYPDNGTIANRKQGHNYA